MRDYATCHQDRINYNKGECQQCYMANYYQKNREKYLERSKAHYQANRESDIRDGWERKVKSYGITVADYDRMFKEQMGGCAICGVEPKPRHHLVIDHCHTTGKVRGLLCRKCNLNLAAMEQKGWIEAAKRYLDSEAKMHTCKICGPECAC